MGAKERSEKTQLARMIHRANLARKPKKPKLRKPYRPWMHKNGVIARIPGTFGNVSILAKRCGCGLTTMKRWLEREDWDGVRDALKQEREASILTSRYNVFALAHYSSDDSVRFRANQFILEKLDPDFAPTQKVQIEGGDKPIQHQHDHRVVLTTEDVLKLPLDQREKMLEAMEEADAEVIDDG